MYRREKRIIVTLIGTVLIFVLYALYAYQKYFAGSPELLNDFKIWGKAFLIFIPVAVIAQIIIHIVFFIINKIITREDIPTFDDERDKLIELKATRVSHWTYGLGFALAMGSQAIGMQPYVLILVMLAGCLLGTLLEALTQIYYYRKGG
jgi:hypothetical protein